jgi:hypothetical protein
MNLLKCAFGVM